MKTLRTSILAFDQLKKQDSGLEYFETFIRYIISARNDLEFQTVYELVKEISLERSDVVMTIAEKLITEGMEMAVIVKATGLTEDETYELNRIILS